MGLKFFPVIFVAVTLALTCPLYAVPPPQLENAFLDHFVGQWRLERQLGSGKISEDSVKAEWVLNHQFIEIQYGFGQASPNYQAIVFIGFDTADKSYVCHWVDIFGARYSALGRGKVDDQLKSIEFRFDSKEGGLTNKFTFDPESKTWASLIRQEENGEWKTFAEEKWTQTSPAK